MERTIARLISKPRLFGFLHYCCFAEVFLVVITSGCSATPKEEGPNALGLHYNLRTISEPRPNRVHILQIDLTDCTTRPTVVIAADPDGEGPAEAALTDPRSLADDPMVLAYVNTNPWQALPDDYGERNRSWFEGQPVDIQGWAVSEGRVRSSAKRSAATVWINDEGQALVGDKSSLGMADDAMTGFQSIVTHAAISVGQDEIRHPRTAIGVNKKGTMMWWVVVDGRQRGYSEGMTLHELGEIMLGLGCWDAVNMDGGGSSILGLRDPDGQLRIKNSPSDRIGGAVRIRPLPTLLTIKRSSRP